MTKSSNSLTLAMAAAMDLPDATTAPEWVHLLPSAQGEVHTFDRRGPYHVTDPAAIIAASFADPRGLPIDENHATDLAAPLGQPAPARGWIKELQSRADGIWGRVEWTEAGRALVVDRAYRGISPVFMHDKSGAIARLARASLVNFPNLRGLAALHQETTMSFADQLAEKLGLPKGATEDAILAALSTTGGAATALQSAITELGTVLGVEGEPAAVLTAARAAKAAIGTGTAIPALQAEIVTLTTKLNSLTEGQARARAEAFVDGEVKAGRAGVKPLRDHYVAMHMADPARVEKELGALPILGASGTLVTPPDGKSGTVALNAEQQQVAAALGISVETYTKTLKLEAGQ